MNASSSDRPVVVAGHSCLDVIPDLGAHPETGDTLIRPGKLIEVGPVELAPGGAVSNTGLALHRLGVRTRLTGKIGTDLFGRALYEELRGVAPRLAEGMIRVEDTSTSYTVVVSPPGVDRIFFHHPGANDEFAPAEIDPEEAGEARLFHFGYPPIMRATYADGGDALAELFRTLRARSVPVSLDMAQPDPDSPAGRVDWTNWLRTVLPHVDLFAPSFEELLYMLDRERYEELRGGEATTDLLKAAGPGVLGRLSRLVHRMGGPLTVIKLGRHGLYLHAPEDADRLTPLVEAFALEPEAWTGRRLIRACFSAETVGTTGAGDTTVAGVIAALLRGLEPERLLTAAVGVGAFSVEAPDATSGVPSWTAVRTRIRKGWSPLPLDLDLSDWTPSDEEALWYGPHDPKSIRTRTSP